MMPDAGGLLRAGAVEDKHGQMKKDDITFARQRQEPTRDHRSE
jgi:hypothetical protein